MYVCVDESWADEPALDIDLAHTIVESSGRLGLHRDYFTVLHQDRVLSVQQLALGGVDDGCVDQVEALVTLVCPRFHL